MWSRGLRGKGILLEGSSNSIPTHLLVGILRRGAIAGL